jgi:chromosome segregation ATPase
VLQKTHYFVACQGYTKPSSSLNLFFQNASLERKQHESWVTVRQEARKSSEAASELQTLRTRLTTVEGKLVEKEFEISRLKEENNSLKETVEKISRSSVGKGEGRKSIF